MCDYSSLSAEAAGAQSEELHTCYAPPTTHPTTHPPHTHAQNKLKGKDAAEDQAITGDASEQCELLWRHFLAHGGSDLSELEIEPIQIGMHVCVGLLRFCPLYHLSPPHRRDPSI